MTVTTLAPRARRKMTPAPPPDQITQYALDVIAGRYVTGQLVKRACERHLTDLATGRERGLYFDAEAGMKAVRFFGLLRHYKGDLGREDNGRGAFIRLIPWEVFLVGCAFGWKRTDGLRRFRNVYAEVAKKNGKTLIGAGAMLLLAFFDDEPGAECYSIATKEDQAKLSWNDGVQFRAKNPSIARRVHKIGKRLVSEESASFWMPLGRDSDVGDQGINAHGGLVDELHVLDSRDPIDNLETATSSRSQPMIWKITTAGVKRESVWAEERSDAVAILEGRATDDSTLVLIYTLDEGDDPFDEAVWPKANPSLGVSVNVDTLRDQAAKAKRSPGKLAAFLRFRMNIPTAVATRALSIDEWDECHGLGPDHTRGEAPTFEEYETWTDTAIPKGAAGYGGLDLASVRDLTALLFVHRDGEGFVNVRGWFWCPAEGIEERSRRDGVPYADWARDGWLIATPGNVTDYTYVRRTFTGTYLDGDKIAHDKECLSDRNQVDELGYDRWNATQLATEFTEDGATCVAISQTYAGLSPGWREIERLILERKLRHGSHPILRWMAGNVEVETDGAGNQKPSKAKSSERIDGMVALNMGIARLIVHAAEPEVEPFVLFGKAR